MISRSSPVSSPVQVKEYFNRKDPHSIKLRKLTSLYATTEKGKLDFQWPSDEQAQTLFQNGVKSTLQKLEIYHSDSGAISGLRITLSNGAMSPLFNGSKKGKGSETLMFDQSKRIQKLALRVGSTVAYGMEFFDKENKELAGWCDFSHNKLRPKFQYVPNGEEVIGIYGLQGHGKNIYNFGFITCYFGQPH